MARMIEIDTEESEDIDEAKAFLKAADTVCVMRCVVFYFECPVCGAQAKAIKAKNGHIHAYCDSCMTQVME